MIKQHDDRTPAPFAVAQRSTAECLGLLAEAQGLFTEHGIDFRLVAFETAAERGVQGLLAGEWDYIGAIAESW